MGVAPLGIKVKIFDSRIGYPNPFVVWHRHCISVLVSFVGKGAGWLKFITVLRRQALLRIFWNFFDPKRGTVAFFRFVSKCSAAIDHQ